MQVQQLERQVQSAERSAGGLGRAFGAVGQGLRAGAGFALAEAGLQGIHQVFGFIADSVVGMNSRLEQATATFRVFTGSAQEASQIVQALSREADITPFDTQEMIRAGATLISVVHGDQKALMDLMQTAEALAALKPEQGLEGAAFAVREALGGDLTSLRERFEVDTTAIENLQRRGVPALQALSQGLQQVGIDSRLVQALAQTFPGLTSNVVSAFNEIRRRIGEGIFEQLRNGLVALNNALERNRDAIYAWATQVGAILYAVVGRIGSILGGLAQQFLNWIQPGLGDQIKAQFDGITSSVEGTDKAAKDATPSVQRLDQALSLPEARQALEGARGNMDALRNLSNQTQAPVKQLARDLGEAGLAAAEIQFQADRVRDAYQAQIEPLERQLRTLQQSADLQRVQNALATNRSTVERLRLEREIAALAQAAGGAEDPAAEGLTVRQRLIALALQDRRLQVEQLGLQDQQRPIVQELQQRIADLTEQQRQALAPLELALKTQKERIDGLQLERQRWEVLGQKIQEAIDKVNNTQIKAKTAAPDDAEVATRAQELENIGKTFGERFQKGWDEWLAGSDLFTAIGNHLQQWYDDVGKPLATRIGTDFGDAVGTAIGTRLPDAIQKAVIARLTRPSGNDPIADWLKRLLMQGAEPPTGAARVDVGTAAGRPTALPLVNRDVPRSGGPQPAAPITIEVGGVDVQVGEGAGAQSRDALIDELTESLGREVATQVVDALIATEQNTDLPPNSLVQGAGR